MSFPQVFFLPLVRGRRFCVRHAPPGRSIGAIVFVHPFAEEMNKARRMAALQARALAADGFEVLEVDLFGCGDSDGDFGDADWSQWRDDVRAAAAWLYAETGHRPVLWGLRVGCLLACEAARSMAPAPDLLFWQPVTSGKQALQQFLRVHVAGQLLDDPTAGRTGTAQLRARWGRGDPVEIAGYSVAPGLAQGLEAADCTPPGAPVRVAWMEVAAEAAAEPSPAVRGQLERWQGAGHRIERIAVSGSPFWQSLEITECPTLLDATRNVVARWHA